VSVGSFESFFPTLEIIFDGVAGERFAGGNFVNLADHLACLPGRLAAHAGHMGSQLVPVSDLLRPAFIDFLGRALTLLAVRSDEDSKPILGFGKTSKTSRDSQCRLSRFWDV
jgi:hypothetical protein